MPRKVSINSGSFYQYRDHASGRQTEFPMTKDSKMTRDRTGVAGER